MSPSFPPRLWVTIFLNNIKLILFVDELQDPLLSAQSALGIGARMARQINRL